MFDVLFLNKITQLKLLDRMFEKYCVFYLFLKSNRIVSFISFLNIYVTNTLANKKLQFYFSTILYYSIQ